MKKVTITKPDGTGILTKEEDGRWTISINGKTAGSTYYTTDQVEKVIASSKAAGFVVVIE